MTLRELYEYALIEMNKVDAPSLLLEDFNYLINKAVQQYINKVYNRYDINQQSTDDIRVLKATAEIPLTTENKTPLSGKVGSKQKFMYSANLPDDYVHLLNCIVEYKVKKPFKCYNLDDHVDFPARRLTADMAAGILHNAYMKPDYKRPYYYINNVSTVQKEDQSELLDAVVDNDTFDSTLTDSVKDANTRKSNASKVRIEIRFGNDDVFEPVSLFVDYIKAPMFIRLTYDDITSTEDTTRPLEFPDYVCYEIVNELVKLLMENASDDRIRSHYPINQTIANPLQSGEQS